MQPLELLVADLRVLSKKIGPLTPDTLPTLSALLAMPRYLDLPIEEERRIAFLADLNAAVDDLPDAERKYARLLFSRDGTGTNITHRRGLAGMNSIPNITVKWREHYIFALVASRLLGYAGRSLIEDSGPGYRHDRITYRTIMDPADLREVAIEYIYDVRIIRDGTYIYLIGDETRDAGKVVEPWTITSGQLHVGDVPFDPTASAGTMLHVVYLGRRYMAGEAARIATTEKRLYPAVDEQNSAGAQTGRLPSPLVIEVHCPLQYCPQYERIEYEGNSVNAPPIAQELVSRSSDAPMIYEIDDTRPLTRYGLNWTITSHPPYN